MKSRLRGLGKVITDVMFHSTWTRNLSIEWSQPKKNSLKQNKQLIFEMSTFWKITRRTTHDVNVIHLYFVLTSIKGSLKQHMEFYIFFIAFVEFSENW